MKIELNIIETFNKMSVSEKQAFLIKLFGKSYFITLFSGDLMAISHYIKDVINSVDYNQEVKSNTLNGIIELRKDLEEISNFIDRYKTNLIGVKSLEAFSIGLAGEWKFRHEAYNYAFNLWVEGFELSKMVSIPKIEDFI